MEIERETLKGVIVGRKLESTMNMKEMFVGKAFGSTVDVVLKKMNHTERENELKILRFEATEN